ncbi:MAG: AMP-binding protein [Solirubrobacterales bacterium]|nr:AMP-binding protein [Solirubrobacterales bacterium]
MGSATAATQARPKALETATLCEAFQTTAAEYAERPALRLKDTDFECSWAEFAATVRRRAAAFAALGVGRGDTVGFMLVNRPALHLCDAAAMHVGATCFSIYNTSSVEQIEYVVGDAASRVVVTEPQLLDKLLEVRERVDTLEQIIVVGEAREGAISLEEFEALGSGSFDFDAAWRSVESDDVLCLIYTSGTTGPPKGVQLTHANVMSDARALLEVIDFTPGGRSVSFLPTAHAADRILQLYGSMVYGHAVHCCPDPRQVVAYTIEVKPTVWGGVPRIWEKLKAALEAQGIADPEALSEEQKAAIRSNLGLEECEWFGVGAAPTPPEVIHYFAALGIEICELWGMSETTVVATVNPPGRVRVGTVGLPLPGVELKLAEDGELLVRGPMVMKGYRNMPEKTAETLSEDGWLATGDVGEIDEEGYLKIVDRKKELIINATGKNMSPANIEAKVKAACPLVAQVVAIGDRRPYNVALITLDPDACGAFAAEHGLEDASPAAMARQEAVREAVAAGVEEGNAALSRAEQVKKFRLIEGEWEPGGEELTPTLKLKRKPIGEKYAAEIEALYAA